MSTRIRTLVSLDREDKAWLDHESRVRGVAMTDLVRLAVRRLRKEINRPDLAELLRSTSGTWRKDDGLAYQRRLRAGWDRRR